MSYPQSYPPMGYPQPTDPWTPPQQPAAPQWPMPAQNYQAPPPQVPQQPAPQGSLDDFYGQPSSGHGPSWSFKDKPIGHAYVGIVARPVTNGDVQAQTNPTTGQIQTYKDGRTKFVLKLPMMVTADQAFPEGKAQWYVAGRAREELARAMSEAGAPEGPPEAGAAIRVQLVARRPIPGLNPANEVQVTYQRPAGAGNAPAPQPPAEPVAQPEPPAQQQQQQQVSAAPPAQPGPAAPPVQTAAGLDDEQAKLLARLVAGS